MGRFLIGLSDKKTRNPRIAGGKGSGLAWLVRYGFRVPAAFIIPTAAFHRIQSRLLREMMPGEEDITPERLGEARERIVNEPLPSSVQAAAIEAFAGLGNRVAVRSSMAGEDSCFASFAGQLDTYLDIGDEEALLEAVKKCLASSFNWRLWRYQQEQGQNLEHILKTMSMAVIIQDMVEAKVSGVAFSADPNTGTRDVVIEAVPGSGKDLVQGHVVPYRYIVDDSGRLEQAATQSADISLFSLEKVLELAKTVRNIASYCRHHQDIEWAWDGHDFYFLQNRPITALPGQQIYSARLVADMSPGLIKPLLWSTKSRSMVRSVFGRICRELLGPHQIDFATYIKRIHSRTYADMTAFGDFLVKLGLPANFFEMLTRNEKSKKRIKLLRIKNLPVMLRMMQFAWRHLRDAEEIDSFVQIQSSRLEPFRDTDWPAHSPNELIDTFERLMELHAQTQWYIFIGPLNMTLRYRLLSRMLRGLPDVENPGNLLRGIEDLRALLPNSYIRRMSRMAQELEKPILDIMVKGETEKLNEQLLTSDPGRKLMQQMQEFLSNFGFLSANGSDFSMVPWSEDPSPVWRSIGRQALQKPLMNTDRIDDQQEQEVLRIRRQFKGLRRVMFDRLLRSTVRYLKLRESTSLIMSEETYLMRGILMGIASALKREGRLGEASDIFYLYYDELCLWIKGDLLDEEAIKRIESRKNEMARDALIDPPEIFRGMRPSPLDDALSGDFDYLEGIPGSPGKMRGNARIVTDPSSVSAQLKHDDILVVPFTDVGWTPLLPGIGGIIAETGGQLSHTSIIAREYGLPSVVSVKDATRRIRDGQTVIIDGNKGRVYLEPD
jgi:phosphohistidine swiveling domain-containing protein